GLPAWLLSLVLHFSVLTTLGLGVQMHSPEPKMEATREGSIVLVARSAGRDDYFSDRIMGGISAAGATVASNDQAASLPNALEQPAAIAAELPAPREPFAGAGLAVGLPSANVM